MFHRFIVFAASMLSLSSFAAMAASISVGTASAPTPVQVIEYYHVGLDHYFVTADAGEISALDGGKFVGWARTGSQFTAYSPTPASVGKNSVCRFYGRPEAGLDSHFYSGAPDECAAVLAKFPSSWMLESGDVFQIEMPDRATGACSATTIPVFRLFNNRLDANHRYTIDINTRNAMLARGYITEGYGPDGVVFCAVEPTTSTPPPSSDPFSVTMLVTQLAADTFDFSSAVALNTAAIVSYNWDFGDGTDATGPTASHRFSLSGTFPVVLTVADSKGAVAKAAKDVAAGTTIVPTPPTPPSSPADDFAARRSAPGVVRWFDFDTPAQLGTIGSGSGNFGIFSNNGNNNLLPVIDTNVKASGSGSLRFDIATIVDTQWYANFSPDLSVRFGANSKFYVQWRQRFNQAMVDTIFLGIDGNDQAGIKQAIIGPGDTAVNKWGSCETIHLVTQTFYQHRFPFLYNSCTGSSSHGAYAGLFATTGPDGATEYYQNARPSCNRTRVVALGPTAHVDVPSGCFGWTANEWLTFQIEIILGPRTDATAGADFANSTVRMWGAREGQASVLLVDWKPGVPGYFPLAAGSIAEDQQYGKIWLLPYMTNGSNTQIHPLAQTWYDELIVSRQPINDPLISKPPPGITVAPAPVSSSGGPYPAWRQGKAVGQWFPIPNTANMGGVTTASTTIDVWNGLGACPTSWWSLAAGGDGIPFNAVFSIELAADKPAWVMKHPSSPPEAYSLTSPYYADGAPVARHTYFSTQCITAAHDRTGIDRVMLFSDFAAYGVFKGGQFGGVHRLTAFASEMVNGIPQEHGRT